jgi:nitrogen PTS system EIIA component
MRGYSDSELAAIEEGQRVETSEEGAPILSRLSAENVQVPLQGRTKPSVLESLIEVAGRTWQIWEPATVLKAVLEREEIFSTGFENGVAIPHPRNPLPDVLGQSIVAFGRTLSGIPFGAPRRQLTDL